MNKPLDSENMVNKNSVNDENPASSNEQNEKRSIENVEETPVVVESNEVEAVQTPENEEAVPVSNESLKTEAVPDVKTTEEVNPVSVEPPTEEVAEEVAEVVMENSVKEPEFAAQPEQEPEKPEEPKPEEVKKELIEKSYTELPSTKEGILERLAVVVESEITDKLRSEAEALKHAFYKIKRQETEEAKKLFLEEGGVEEEFKAIEDELDEKLKELLAVFKEKKAALASEEEKRKENNLALKREIIEKIKGLSETANEDFYKAYADFRKLQQQWKEIKLIPQSAENTLWKEYQLYNEKFYDLLKINNEMRDYDFKKNLELKQSLCESVEKLESENDVISAFYQLQKFHQEWREIGPVAKELREEIWTRFKQASAVINKRHQEHFEAIRIIEQRNLDEKIALCEEVEAIDYSKLKTFKDWDEQNKRVLELQEKWKTIGFAPKKNNVKVFERFRSACDVFFRNKGEFYKGIKDGMEENLEKKKALCEQAEALKDSQDWKETTDKFIALQKEWKVIGPISRKHSEAIWKRFISACDYFFEQKNTHFSSQKTEEVENLKKKKEIIEKINAIDETLPSNEAVAQIRALMSEWNMVGFVPFRDKDKIYKEYRKAVDKHFDRLKIDETERRLQNFKSNINDIGGKDRSKNKLFSERDKLMRTYERLRSDIQTYENNIGFLSVSSKGGGGLVKEMNRKIDSLKEELNLIVKKIEVIDENLDSQDKE